LPPPLLGLPAFGELIIGCVVKNVWNCAHRPVGEGRPALVIVGFRSHNYFLDGSGLRNCPVTS
jgi:hypothetical protein